MRVQPDALSTVRTICGRHSVAFSNGELTITELMCSAGLCGVPLWQPRQE